MGQTAELVCEECRRRAGDRAAGWQACVVDIDDDGQDVLISYCPACTDREFGDGT